MSPTPEQTPDTVIDVGGASPYQVVVGRELLHRLPGILGDHVQRVAVVGSAELPALVARVTEALSPGYEVLPLPIPDGEQAKTAATAADCWERLGAAGFTRSDAVVTVGGGATTDLGGFVAATWLRGVRVVHVPTTLLGMVDAAVGGKTGINTGAGKNLVGSFHEPAAVLCDLALLDTLPRAELVAGLGEVVKCGFIADPEILRLVEETDPELITAGSPVLRELVERSVRVKVEVVVGDLRETGGAAGHPGREVLNYGHTMAHAVERVTGYAVRHGEAVALGCVYVAELARRAGSLSPELAERHRTALARVGLPVTLAEAVAGTDPGGGPVPGFADLLAAMRVDKKARGSQLRFVVLEDLGRPVVLAGPSEDDLHAAYLAIGGRG